MVKSLNKAQLKFGQRWSHFHAFSYVVLAQLENLYFDIKKK